MSKTSKRAVLAAERKVQCLEMTKQGFSPSIIGKQLGITRVSVYRAVRAALRDLPRLPAEELRQLEGQRLDEYLARLAPRILKGDCRAIEVAVKIAERRSKLFGLDVAPELLAVAAPVVIVRAIPDGYMDIPAIEAPHNGYQPSRHEENAHPFRDYSRSQE